MSNMQYSPDVIAIPWFRQDVVQTAGEEMDNQRSRQQPVSCHTRQAVVRQLILFVSFSLVAERERDSARLVLNPERRKTVYICS